MRKEGSLVKTGERPRVLLLRVCLSPPEAEQCREQQKQVRRDQEGEVGQWHDSFAELGCSERGWCLGEENE